MLGDAEVLEDLPGRVRQPLDAAAAQANRQPVNRLVEVGVRLPPVEGLGQLFSHALLWLGEARQP